MKAIVETKYELRNETITSTHVFPAYSNEIEESLKRQLTLCQKLGKKYSITLRIESNGNSQSSS